jgi:hypothetical protein
VRGIFQRLLALLGESELGCGYPITSWLVELCHYFPPSEASRRAQTARDSLSLVFIFSLYHLDYGPFPKLLQRGMAAVSLSRRCGNTAHHFLFDAIEPRMVGFPAWAHFCAYADLHEVTSPIGITG